MDCLSFDNIDHGVRCGDMCDEADASLEKSAEEEDRRECRDEWGELLRQTKSRREDGVASDTHASFDAATESAYGEWRARIRQSTQFRYIRGFEKAE